MAESFGEKEMGENIPVNIDWNVFVESSDEGDGENILNASQGMMEAGEQGQKNKNEVNCILISLSTGDVIRTGGLPTHFQHFNFSPSKLSW